MGYRFNQFPEQDRKAIGVSIAAWTLGFACLFADGGTAVRDQQNAYALARLADKRASAAPAAPARPRQECHALPPIDSRATGRGPGSIVSAVVEEAPDCETAVRDPANITRTIAYIGHATVFKVDCTMPGGMLRVSILDPGTDRRLTTGVVQTDAGTYAEDESIPAACGQPAPVRG